MTLTKIRMLINSQFNNCQLVSIFYSRIINNKINHFHERSLNVTYYDKKVLDLDGSVPILGGLKEVTTLSAFKSGIKLVASPSKLCKWCLPNIGFI